MKRALFILCIIGIATLICSSCQESESKLIGKARLIGNENIQLKKKIEEKDQQIESLKKEMEQIQLKSAEDLEKAGDASIKSLRLLLVSEKDNENLRKEVEQLKAEIKKLKAQIE